MSTKRRRRIKTTRRMSARSVAGSLRRRGLMSGRKVRSAIRRRRKNPFEKKFDLKRGDKIVITMDGERFLGKVLTAEHYGARDGWFIEIDKDRGGYGYWKQGSDGGTVEKLKGGGR